MKRIPATITERERSHAYAEGQKAFIDGKRCGDNPYIDKNKELEAAWWKGWDAAKKAGKSQLTGRGGSRALLL